MAQSQKWDVRWDKLQPVGPMPVAYYSGGRDGSKKEGLVSCGEGGVGEARGQA